jgi:hypothetical protein
MTEVWGEGARTKVQGEGSARELIRVFKVSGRGESSLALMLLALYR